MTQPDPFNTAMTVEPPPDIVYGQIDFDLYFCVLQKGVGKVQFDPVQHDVRDRRTAVNLAIAPLPSSNLQYSVERNFIAEFPNDGWMKIVLPSLKALGVNDLKALGGAYVKAELIKYGEYTNADGETRNRTAPKILEIYASESEAEEASGTGHTEVDNDDPAAVALNGKPESAPANDAEKLTAAAFLPAIVAQCRNGNGIDLGKVEAALKANPLLGKHFNLTSPEVVTACQQVMAEPQF